jgi:hypothetical protein
MVARSRRFGMRHIVLLLALCLGCEDEVVPVQQSKGSKGKSKGKKSEQTTEIVATPIDSVETIRLQALNGESQEAVAAAKGLLESSAEEAENPILWSVVENASQDLPDQGAAILATLSPEAPLAGQVTRTNELRAVLSERSSDIDSLKSRASRAVGQEQAVLQAKIALVERPEEAFDRRADKASSAVALEQLKRASKMRAEAALFAETAAGVEGASAALFRADAWLDLEPVLDGRAFAELQKVGSDATREQQVEAKLRMARMVMDGGSYPGMSSEGEATSAPTVTDAQGWATDVLLDSLAVADRHHMMEALDLVVEAGLLGASLEIAVAHAGQVDLALDVREGGDAEYRARAKALLAMVAFRAGHVQTALRAGRDGMVLGAEASPDAAWWGGLAAVQVQQ